MRKIVATVLTLSAFLMLTGCGKDNTTYTKEAPAIPETPTNGTNVIVSADNGSNVGLSYTQVGENAVLVECGDGDGYSCGVTVYEVSETSSDDNETKD